MQISEMQTLQMAVVKQGEARQTGRTVPYRVGRCGGEVFIIIDGTELSDDKAATGEWIPLRHLLPVMDRWVREDAAAVARGGGPIVRCGEHLEPALPGNSTMSEEMVAVLRNEGMLMSEFMVAVLLPSCPTQLSSEKSVLNPFLGLDDVFGVYLEFFDPVAVVEVPLDRVFDPERAS